MRTKKNIKILLILLSSFILPMLLATPQGIAQEDETVTFTYASGGVGGNLGDWDPAIDSSTQFNCLEVMVVLDGNSIFRPFLAESWTIEPRPDEGGNTGGMKSITFQLRENVTFHDGSEWNATVAKWNLDRITYISGYTQTKWQSRYWLTPALMEDFFTENWNLSWAESDPLDVEGSSIRIPLMNETTILGPYEINVTLNKWATSLELFSSIEMISMETYGIYNETAIRGYGDTEPFPSSTTTHLVGTGPYVFQYANALDDIALTTKNMNYWNRTNLEAEERFVAEEVYTRWYGDSGARTSALVNQEADASGHAIGNELADLDAIKANPGINYYVAGYDPQIDCVTMLGAEGSNKPLPELGGLTFRQAYAVAAGRPLPTGISRTVRRALSYAFNYTGYFTDVYTSVGGIMSENPLGTECIYNTGDVTRMDMNVSKAREIMFEDPFYAAELTSRGLTLSSSDAEWENVGVTDGIQNMTYLSVTGSPKPAYFGSALNSIGFGLGEVTYTDAIYTEYMVTGKCLRFDAWSYVWPTSNTAPMEWMGSGFNLIYGSFNFVLISAGFNFALLHNSTIDQYMADAPFKGGQELQDIYNNFSYDLLNYHSPFLYLAHSEVGLGLNAKWIVDDYALSRGLAVHYLGYNPPIPTPPVIPGFPVAITTVFSILAIVVITQKKRK